MSLFSRSFSIVKSIFTPQVCSILWITLFIMLTGNSALFGHIHKLYAFDKQHFLFLISLGLFFTLTTAIFFLLLAYGKKARWVLAFFLIAASLAAYYMDTYGVIIDTVMFDNIFQTNRQELMGLVTAKMLFRLGIFGILPAWLVLRAKSFQQAPTERYVSRLALVGVLSLLAMLVVIPFTSAYAYFIREHKVARMYANPTFFTYSAIKYLTQGLTTTKITDIAPVAEDAVEIGPQKKHELLIMVVGETARADRFSLNGYHRITNPELAKQDVLSLRNVSSCGTSTGVSIPCMFSVLGRKEYDKDKALRMENALDVLADNGISILWRDNNSDSKGVATRMQYEDFKSPTLNPVCADECRDIGMLNGLDEYIKSQKDKDILIVLHQMGNHGPEYYRRYPKEFERFKPACQTGELSTCTQEEINNAYDNAILYTDYFLSQAIKFLKKYDNTHETAMLYVSDHGESLGEHGIYLHAMPYMIAPKEQTHVPAIIWMGNHFDYKLDQLKPYQDAALSHDDVFCTLLVAYELDSKTCSTKHNMLMQNLDIQAMLADDLPHG